MPTTTLGSSCPCRAKCRVHGDDPVAVAVESESDIGLAVHDRALERLRRCRAATGVDVRAVGRVEEREHFGAGLREHRRRDAVGRAVGAVEDDACAFELRRERYEEVLVLLHQAARIADETDPTLGRAREDVVAGHRGLDLILRRVRQFQAAVIEELDPVVWRRVVRGADDAARDEVPAPREVRETGRGDMADETDFHPDRAQSRGESALEHAATSPRVASDDDAVPRSTQDIARRPAQPQRELRREVLVRDTANAIGPEKTSHERRAASPRGANTTSLERVSPAKPGD